MEKFTEVFLGNQRPAVYLSFTRMAEHFIVLLIALLCLVTTSSCDDSSPTCRKYSDYSRFETKQGTPIKSISVRCDMSERVTAGKKLSTYDITSLVSTFVKPEVDNASLVTVYLSFRCYSPMEIRFINSRNIVYSNILLFLRLYPCTVSTQSLLVLSNATDLRSFNYDWSFQRRSILPEERKETFATSLKEISYAGFSLNDFNNIAGVFYDTQKVFSNLAQIEVYVPYRVKQISTDQWRLAMPNLQYLDLRWNSLTKPPEFPWNNSTLEIFRELRRGSRDETVDVGQNLYVRGLDLTGNDIDDLSSHEFRGFLHKLALRMNVLRTIGPTCFHGLQGIQSIDLSANMLTSLPENLFHGLTSLLHIDLSYNRISVINKKLFHGLINIKRIYLNGNKLSYIEDGLFNTLDNLEVLRLDSNKIKTIVRNPFSPSSSLRKLHLQNNNLPSLPSWIFYLKKIKKLDLSNNRITLLDLTWVNRTDLDQFLNVPEIMLAGNPLTCDCKMAATVKLISPVLEKHPEIKPRFSSWLCDWPHELKGKSFLDTNTTYEWMTRENAQNCPSVCSCGKRCSDGHFVIDCESQSLEEIPSSMPQGRIELNLINNHIRDIPPYSYLENVTVLKLTNNNVDELQSLFKGLKHVKTLLLDSNLLASLPEEIKKLNITRMALSGNNFKCNCNTKWMTHWLLKNKQRIRDYDKVLCSSGQFRFLGKPMYNLRDNMFICPTTMPHPSISTTSHPATNTTPHPSTNTTPHPSTSTTPHPSTNTTPHPSTSTTPHPSTNTTPHPSTNTTPHPSTNTTPHPSTSTTPHPSTNTTPHPSTSTTPHPSTNTTPHPSTSTTPHPSTNTTPHPSTNTTPHPSTNTTPHPSTSTTPHPSTNTTPHPSTNTTPHPSTSTTPHPSTNTTPHPSTSTTPHPSTNTTPHPSTSTTPHPSTNTTPHPSTSTTPHPSTNTTPHPSTSTTSHPSTNTKPYPSPAASEDPKPYLNIAVTAAFVLCGLLLLTVITVILL